MRKLVVLVTILVMIAAAVPAGGSPSVRRNDIAFSVWLFPTERKDHLEWYAAVAWKDTSVAGGRGIWSVAGFLRGRCVRKETKRRTSTRCTSDDYIPAHPKRDFDMTADAQEAELRVRRRGKTHLVRWTGSPRPGGYFAEEACNDGQGVGAGMMRLAHARGRFFGRRVRPGRKLEYAYLAAGVMASRCSGDMQFDFDPDTGTARLTIAG